MIIKDEAVKYLKKAIPLLQDDMRWMNEKYVAAYSSFCDSNGFCNGNAFDVAVAQAKRLKSGNHNYKGLGTRKGRVELTHTTMLRGDMEKSDAFEDALKREGHNVS